ncbi:hypothetical protein EJ02DRAFT_355777 [Clathrospora elynae]|uniref:MULE transposase domain-containing protein n=1 Tax=Clathrospora elynae TaxID=706981 RepID=A0A6A5SB79_9PLEO|nr:hypothetical protein EJ02DRAFT_355777 [Clathrospora elynae]
MSGEDFVHYGWHIQAFHDFLQYLEAVPRCFVTDCEPALKSALTAFFPGIHQRLCIWHINQNVLKKAVETSWNVKNGTTDNEKL